MRRRHPLKTQQGFTVLEIIAVLLILGVLAAFAVTRYTDFQKSAKQETFNTIIAEINAREFLTWSDQKISPSGYIDDAKVFGKMNYSMAPHYGWNPGDPTLTGGTIIFKGEAFTLSRTVSTRDKPAIWKEN